MQLTGLAAEVTPPMVAALLVRRKPNVLDQTVGDPPERLFDITVMQIMAEVMAVTGPNPLGARRDLALQCAAYGVGSSIEYSLVPEQQIAGGQGRGWFLKLKFDQLLADLRAMPAGGGTAGGLSRGNFPKAPTYPDPIRRR